MNRTAIEWLKGVVTHKTAIVSDIHSNLEAFTAVLAEIDRLGAALAAAGGVDDATLIGRSLRLAAQRSFAARICLVQTPAKSRFVTGPGGTSGGAGFEHLRGGAPTGQHIAQLLQRDRLAHHFIHVGRNFPLRLHLRPPTCQ